MSTVQAKKPSQQEKDTPARKLRVGVVASMKKGLEQFIYREISHLEQTGVEVHLYPTKVGQGLYAPRPSWITHYWTIASVLLRQLKAFLHQPQVYVRLLWEAFRLGATEDFLLAAYFSESMRELDAIYCTFGDRKLFVGYFGKRLTGRPLLCTVHAYEIYQNPNPKLFRQALAACDQLITISEYNVKRLEELYGYDPKLIEKVTYSIDLQDYRPRNLFRILIVGFFVERKGHRYLFEAVKQLDDKDIEIWVVGDVGAEEDSVDVRQLAKEYGIDDQVAFFGKQSGTALKATYHACDVFCLPCHFDAVGVGEGFPNVIIEAMACGKPVISTNHVAIPSILPQVLVDEKDASQLADAIRQMMASESMRKELGDLNRSLAEDNFAPSNVERTVELVRQVCLRELS